MNLFGYAKEVKELFKKFYDMEPYLFIDEKEWQHIITTYEKDDVVDELLNVYTHIHVRYLRLQKRITERV